MKVITDSKVFLEEIKDSDKLFVLDFTQIGVDRVRD